MSLNLEELRQVFREQEEEADNTAAELKKIKAEAIKARQELERERLALAKAKAQAQQEQARERLAIARAREERAAELQRIKQEQADKQKSRADWVYLVSILATFGGLLVSFILFITIILKG